MKRIIKSAEAMNTNSDSGLVKLRVEYEVYTRFGSGGIKRATISGPTLLDALTKMVGKMGLYLLPEEIQERQMSPKDIVEEIKMSNGDGCDFIFLLKNLSTGETYIQEEYDEEEW